MRYRFYTADVFTNRVFGGNPLAVFPNGEGLGTSQMHQIAREFNLSETVFVFPAEQAGHTRRLRIFTPGAELPFAGHPTIGTAHVLASIGEITLQEGVTSVVFEEGVGPVPVSIHGEDGRPVFAKLTAVQLPEFGPPPPSLDTIAAALSLDVSDLLAGENEPQAVSCGLPFLFVPVRDRGTIGRVRLNRDAWQRFVAPYWAPHLYVFTYDPELRGSDLRARMFAPAMEIEEDPATGAAATALGGYLGVRDNTSDGTLHWKVEQGFEMGRPSILYVEAEKAKGKIVVIRVGGAAVLVSEGTMDVPIAP
ncbi:MAG: PhzF family phenazine biosynthesis protein [Candidatus Methylomirabilales bacterium]